jgi:hypothetical protein
LRLCYFVAPSLTRGRVCNLRVQLLLGLARAVTLESRFRRTRGHILLSHLRLHQPGRPGARILYPPGTGWPSYTPGHCVPFLSPLTTRRDYGGGILTRLHMSYCYWSFLCNSEAGQIEIVVYSIRIHGNVCFADKNLYVTILSETRPEGHIYECL